MLKSLTKSRRSPCEASGSIASLAQVLAIGAAFSLGSALGAEQPTPTAPPEPDGGTPKRVRTVPVAPSTDDAAASKPKGAERYGGDAEYRRCIDASDGTNVAWGLCGSELIEREDARLNAAWRRVFAPGSPAKGPDLLDEQRAWIAFKELSCRHYASGDYGREGQVLSFPVCRAGVIAERTAALLAYRDDTTP